jgi:hypothetical protein
MGIHNVAPRERTTPSYKCPKCNKDYSKKRLHRHSCVPKSAADADAPHVGDRHKHAGPADSPSSFFNHDKPAEEQTMRPERLLRDFLKIDGGPLGCAVKPYQDVLPLEHVKSIANGTMHFTKDAEDAWASLGLSRPFIFPAERVWSGQPPTFNEFLNELLCNLDRDTQTFFSGVSDGQHTKPAFMECLEQLQKPDITRTNYVVNVKSEKNQVRVHESIYKQLKVRRPAFDPPTTTNITPKGTLVPPHIGTERLSPR